MNFNFRLYHEGYESPVKELEIDDSELEGMDSEQREEYARKVIYNYIIETVEVIEVEEEVEE